MFFRRHNCAAIARRINTLRARDIDRPLTMFAKRRIVTMTLTRVIVRLCSS